MADEIAKPSSIVELYREHQDLLSVYFKSEEEAADCERRAEMGDDRAMRLLSLACDVSVATPFRYTAWEDNDGFGHTLRKSDGPHTGYEYFSADVQTRDKYHKNAMELANLDALDLADSVRMGNRSVTTIYPETHRLILDYERKCSRGTIMPTGSLRYEITPVNAAYLRRSDYSVPTPPSDYSVIFSAENKTWRGDKIDPSLVYNYEYGRYDKRLGVWKFDPKYAEAMTTCAEGGDAKAARRLSSIYAQNEFKEIITQKLGWFKDELYAKNPLYSLVKAKEWERIADHLEGKTTPLEREKFLKEFLYSQDATPEGLYNIGYALFHNEHIGDKAKGIDYLKHAANLNHGSANAARELGEIFQNQFDASGDQHALQVSHFWYKVAASTPMEVMDSDGKVTHYDGHPNAKARVAYLEKAYPQLQTVMLNENAVRNPSPAHIRQYPASMWASEIPITDISHILHDPARGGIEARMQASLTAINAHVEEFEVMTRGIHAKLDELILRQAELDGKIEAVQDEELRGLGHNDKLSREQLTHQRLANAAKERWLKETTRSLLSTVTLSMLTSGAHTMTQLSGSISRASGFSGARDNEVEYREMLIAELEDQKIDTKRCKPQIDALAQTMQEIANSGPLQRLKKDETRSRAIVEGYLRQKIITSGLANCRYLDEYAKQNGLASVDELLAAFQSDDDRLHTALNNLCYGHADSNDMAVLLADANALTGDLAPHQKAFKQFVERIVKDNISEYMTRASQIDVISDLALIDFKTMNVDHTKTNADLVRGVTPLTADEHATRQVDAATKLALTSMFSSQFGVTHIGQYDVNRMFSFYLHRHDRNDELIAAELKDGHVDINARTRKSVQVESKAGMKSYVSRYKEAGKNGNEALQEADSLFTRVCGYEYYLPQAVITSGRGNRFKENPEAPIAYAVTNRVIHDFIEKMSLTDIATYREKIGDKLDSVIAQTFMDFFKEVGHEHVEKFAVARERLRNAFSHKFYGSEFNAYEDKIVTDMLPRFPQFLALYERNLQKELLVAPEDEAKLLQEQIASLDEATRSHLAPDVPKPGSYQARETARKQDHRGTNMTERWQFAG